MKAKVKKVALYTRVSSTDQSPKMQESELVEYVSRGGWSLYKVYSDKVSGANERRPALDSLDDCRRKTIDIVVVWKFDRFARSLKQLLNALELFRTLGIAFVSCTEAIDTLTSAWRDGVPDHWCNRAVGAGADCGTREGWNTSRPKPR